MSRRNVHQRTLEGPRASLTCLLRLPEAALHTVLLQLDPCSLASAAVSCSQLRHAALATISKVEASCSTAEKLASFDLWLEHNSKDLTILTQCSISGNGLQKPFLHQLPCPQLRQLRLQRMELHLGPAEGSPGVLQDCTGLTALDLQECSVECGTFAAIAALPQLQSLSVERCYDRMTHQKFLFAELQHPLLLTQLSLQYGRSAEEGEQLSQLSSLVNLRSLKLAGLRRTGVPGGLPSQLVNLTRLHVEFEYQSPAGQFQQLSTLTSLQELFVACSCDDPSELSGIWHLTQLTSVQLARVDLGDSSSISTRSWARLTALQSLTLQDCMVGPQTLEDLPQVRALSLESFQVWSGLDDLLALSKLTLLTKLQLTPEWYEQMGSLPPGAAFTALTASTHLCSLELGLRCWNVPQDCQLFKPGSLYPHLHTINLLCEDTEDSMALGQQQLQQLCSCCPAVESLSFSLHEPLLTAASPLYQLSALTRLKVNQEVAAAEAAAEAAAAAAVTASVVDVAVQLTGLKQLELWGLPQLRLPALLQLSSLTGLQGLTLHGDHAHMAFKNQACGGAPPDVWMQLLCHLLLDEACQQAMMEQCTAGPPAAPDRGQMIQMLRRFQAELAAALASAEVAEADGGADQVPKAVT